MFCIHLGRHSKRPIGGRWHISDRRSDHQRWIARGHNIGIMLRENRLVVIDIDRGKDAARTFWRERRELCQYVAETRRGIHVYLEGETATRKFPLGDIKASGYVVSPPSVVKYDKKVFWTYRWIVRSALPRFSDYEHLFPIEEHLPQPERRGRIRNVRAYLAKIVSIEGEHGWGAMARAASVCLHAGLSESEATIALLDWNAGPTVRPKWDPRDIARTITRIYRKGRS